MNDVKISKGRIPTEFLVRLADGESWFEILAYREIRGARKGGYPQWCRVRQFALEQFLARAPKEFVSWLRVSGVSWSVGIVDDFNTGDDCPAWPSIRNIALRIDDPGMAALFKLTFG